MNQVANTAEKTETAKRIPSQPLFTVPRGNIRETKDSYLLELEMPGVPKDGLEITVEANELTIIGRRGEKELQGNIIYRESRPVDYRRVFDLDPSIDTGKISAKMEQGVLIMNLPKTENVKPRKIAVVE